MKRFRIDFTQDNPCVDGCYIGRTGEHNATELIITPPAAMTENEAVTSYIIAFVTGGMLIHSEPFEKTETVHIKLWRQLTQNAAIGIQLEAYDDAGDFIGKSEYIRGLKLLPSAHGDNVSADTDNPDLISEFLKIKHSHENKEMLDKFSEDDSGKPLYNGQSIGNSTGSGMTDDQVENLAKNTEARHTHDNKDILDKLGFNYSKTRPTFNNGLTDEVLATQGDVTTRIAEHKSEVLQLISSVPKFAVAVVDELPAENISNTTIYLIRELETEGNLYTEYIYINNAWESLGSQSIDADLTNYAKIEDVPNNKELLERFSETLGDIYGIKYNGVSLLTEFHLLNYATKRPTAEYVYDFIEDFRMWNTDGNILTLYVTDEESTEEEKSMVGKEIADIIFERAEGERVSINNMSEIDFLPYISMINRVTKITIDEIESIAFASIYYPSTAGWLKNDVANVSLSKMRITYYTD